MRGPGPSQEHTLRGHRGTDAVERPRPRGDALDGIEVCPKQAIHDTKAHLDLEAGCQTVKGEQALGSVRTRYSVGDGSGIGRIGRQQELVQALAARAQDKLASPGDPYSFLDSATKSLTAYDDLAGIEPLTSLASSLKGRPEDRLTFLTVPSYPRELDVPTDKANISWQYPQAQTLFTPSPRTRRSARGN
ncbi:LCP family protein [Streptomyces sp. NPDC052020]|uniref:LCP family protein n=1 Tax=Streptomyces sp. NPDC052020 TaxID=3155677 RepID=UPI0034136AEF